MSQQELLKKTVLVLEHAKIEYMLTGSLVSSLQGEPRATHDIDILIELRAESIKDLLSAFKSARYYLEEEDIINAIKNKKMFNLIDTEEGDKIDFWIITDSEFDQSRFKRKYKEEIFGLGINVSRPEDTILMKLKWAALSGGSEKQFLDALRVYEVQYETIDKKYLAEWSIELGVQSALNRIRNEAEIIE